MNINKIKFLEKFCEKNYKEGKNPLPLLRKNVKELENIQFLWEGIFSSFNNYRPEHGSFCVLNEENMEVYFMLPCMKKYDEEGMLTFVNEDEIE